jgi:hypothetical protein
MSGVNVGRIVRKRSVTRLVMTGRISTNGAIVNLEYMIKRNPRSHEVTLGVVTQ